MDVDRIAELLRPFLSATNSCHSEPGRRPSEEPAVLSHTQLQSISTYIDILLRWNARMNLTAIRDPEEIVTRHFGESFFLARHLFPANSVESVSPEAVGADLANQQRPLINPNSLRVADIGSGAGFPGLPIKLWNPHLSLTLIESNHKKATFLREVTRALTLTNVDIRNVRAETLPPSSFDVVTLRAVERLTTLLAPGASLLAPGGRLALLISEAQVSSVVSAETNVRWDDPISLPTSKTGILLIGLREPK